MNKFLFLAFFMSTLGLKAQNDSEANQSRFSVFASMNVGNWMDSRENYDYNPRFGSGLELRYRLNRHEKYNLHIGFLIESLGTKRTFEGGYRHKDQFNLSVPLYLGLEMGKGFYSAINISIDLPFYTYQYTKDIDEIYIYKDFNVNHFNLNIGGGINLGKRFPLKNKRDILLELKVKMTALLGIRANDYWVYDESYPYIIGINIGYQF